MAVTTDRHYDSNYPALLPDEEGILTSFDSSDGLRLAELPASAIRVDSPYAVDSIMCIKPIGLIDAFDSTSAAISKLLFECANIGARQH